MHTNPRFRGDHVIQRCLSRDVWRHKPGSNDTSEGRRHTDSPFSVTSNDKHIGLYEHPVHDKGMIKHIGLYEHPVHDKGMIKHMNIQSFVLVNSVIIL